MRGRYHIDWQVKAQDLGNFRRYQAAERRQDIGVVTLALLEKLSLIHFIVEQMFVAVVLTESIVTEQHRVACQVSHHTVRPVQHWRFDKNELFAVADIQRVASFHYIKIPLRMMVMTIYRVDSVGSTVDRRIGNLCHQFGQRPGVVLFSMVNYDVIDIRQIDFITQVLHKFAAEFMVDGVDQHVFFFADEVAVVAAAAQRFIFCTVKITHFPVTLTNPMNVIFHHNRHSNLNLFSVF